MGSQVLNRWKRCAVVGRVLAIAVALPVAACSSAAEPPAKPNDAEEAIRASADEFVKAFNEGDAKAIASLWTADGKLTDEQGRDFEGQSAIEAEYAALFKASPDAKIVVKIESIDSAAPGVAIEEGKAIVIPTRGGLGTASRYRAVHVLQDGKWRMASVREAPAQVAPLEQLGWMVGKWETKSDDTTVRSDVRWIADKAFLQRDYTVQRGDAGVAAGTQIIGWDPQSQSVRSWSFDSSGGHGTGVWTATPDGWQIETSGALADGTPTASTDSVIRVAGEDSVFGWQSVNRHAGRANLPDTREIVMQRVTD